MAIVICEGVVGSERTAIDDGTVDDPVPLVRGTVGAVDEETTAAADAPPAAGNSVSRHFFSKFLA